MTWVKICGITNLEDALVAVEAGADALGFVFYEKSPRYVDLEKARDIVARTPEHIERVGVFVNTPLKQVIQTSLDSGLTTAQVYGDQAALTDQYRALHNNGPHPKLIVAVNGNCFTDQNQSMGWFISAGFAEHLFALLVDCGSDQQPGGTGNRFDWTKARGAVQAMNTIRPTIVAGGLDPSNVKTAMTLLHPWGVDVSSGVEAVPGKKDPEKVRAFIRAVREADKADQN